MTTKTQTQIARNANAPHGWIECPAHYDADAVTAADIAHDYALRALTADEAEDAGVAADIIAEAADRADRCGESLRLTLPAGQADRVARLLARDNDGCEYEPGRWDLWCVDGTWRIHLDAETRD